MASSKRDSQGSLPDQLAIQQTPTSSESSLLKEQPIKRPKYIRRPKQTKHLRAVLKPKTSVTPRYVTAGINITDENSKNVEDEPTPFGYPSDLEEFSQKLMSQEWRNDIRLKELQKKCSEKLNYYTRIQKDLLNRLYVKEAPKTEMKSVLDLDPRYFTVCEGRPIPERLKIRDYIQTIRESLRTKIMTGYRQDDIMLMEENLLLEQTMIDIVRENYQTYVNIFEEFLYKDHTTSMALLREGETTSNLANDKYEEYRTLAKNYSALRSGLYNSEEKWKNCKIYQRFLYCLSPSIWRNDNLPASISFHSMMDDNQNEDTIFGKYKVTESQNAWSITDILIHYKEECTTESDPVLYFTKPHQLVDVFRFIENQNLSSLMHSEELAIPLELVQEGMRQAEIELDDEIRKLKLDVEALEGGIMWEEERLSYLEKQAISLINDEFKKLIMEDEVLNLHVFVEDVYETRIGPNDANLSMIQMMRGISERYRDELLQLDKLPSDQVALLEGSCYQEQMRIMRFAEKASKQYAELQSLTCHLNRAFEPPFAKPAYKEVKQRSPPIPTAKPPIVPPRDLTEQEKEYLEFFTDFCPFTDSLENYGIESFSKAKPMDKRKPRKRMNLQPHELKGMVNLEKIIMMNA